MIPTLAVLPSTTQMRALVEVANCIDNAVRSEGRLALVMTDVLADVLAAQATVWFTPTGGDQLVCASSRHRAPLAADLTSVLRNAYGGADLFSVEAPADYANPDGETSPDRPGDAPGWLRRHGVTSVSFAPMLADDRLLGAIAVTRGDQQPALDEQEVNFAQAVADLGAITLASARSLADSAAVMDDLRQQNDIIEYMSDALIACDGEYRIVNWNSGAELIYKYSRADALGCDLFALLATQFFAADGVPMEAEAVFAEIAATGSWRGELRERRADGVPLVTLCSATARREGEAEALGLVVVNRDVTEQRRKEHQATHDPLTGLPNRRMLNQRLYDAHARACRSGATLAVLFLDLDGFKPVNDTYGHAAGDEVLRVTAQRLSRLVRRADTVARLGGDEFVVILEEAGERQHVMQVASRLIDTIAAPITLGKAVVSVRPSVGVTIVAGPDTADTTPERLLDTSDEAMYIAKRRRSGLHVAV